MKTENKNLTKDEKVVDDKTSGEVKREKYWLGVLCGLFVPFFISVLIGYSLFEAGSLERKTFFETYWGTFGIIYTIGLIIGAIWGIIVLTCPKQS